MSVDPRIGLGYDIHRLVEDAESSGIRLAGVLVPCRYRLIAHSDGDVALHALCDAVLGALGAGDLGEHFPDTDPAHRGRDSAGFVAAILALPAMDGWRIAHLDLNLIVQAPRLSAYKPAMRARLAELFRLPVDRCGVKARTNEGLDAVGAQQAVVAQAVVLLMPRS